MVLAWFLYSSKAKRPPRTIRQTIKTGTIFLVGKTTDYIVSNFPASFRQSVDSAKNLPLQKGGDHFVVRDFKIPSELVFLKTMIKYQ